TRAQLLPKKRSIRQIGQRVVLREMARVRFAQPKRQGPPSQGRNEDPDDEGDTRESDSESVVNRSANRGAGTVRRPDQIALRIAITVPIGKCGLKRMMVVRP